jgi:hypothetical protein
VDKGHSGLRPGRTRAEGDSVGIVDAMCGPVVGFGTFSSMRATLVVGPASLRHVDD